MDEVQLNALFTGAAGRVDPTRPPPTSAQFIARRRHRRRALIGSAGSVVLVAAVALGSTTIARRESAHPVAAPQRHTITSDPRATAAVIAHDRWTALPKAPISARADAATVWTGSQLIVWGGDPVPSSIAIVTAPPYLRDGAAYTPRTRTWTTLPASPLSARADPVSVWTGRSMFVWGGISQSQHVLTDGALYTPADRAWASVPAAPLTDGRNARAVLSDGKVVLVAGPDADGTIHAASYDPAANAWTRLPVPDPAAGHHAVDISVVATGDQVQLWSEWDHTTAVSARATSTSFGIDRYTLDGATWRWSARGATPRAITSVANAVWTGRQILFPAARRFCGGCSGPAIAAPGVLLDPIDGSTMRISTGPVDDLTPATVWTGAALLALDLDAVGGLRGPGSAAVWDPTADRWMTLPTAPIAATDDTPAIVWTGTSLIVWGAVAAGGERGATATTGGVELG